MSRLFTAATLLAALTFPLATAALAGTEQETFDKLIGKLAPTATDLNIKFKPRLACACFDVLPPTPGVIVRDGAGRIRCGIPGFDGSGNLFAISYCNTYEVLGR